MLDLLLDPNVWASFVTLTVMEIVLGIDNIVFISVLVSRLPESQAARARSWGLGMALIFRILLLLVIAWVIQLQEPLFTLFEHGFSVKDLILIAGGGFLIYKAVHEMHAAIEEPHEARLGNVAQQAFGAIIAQIVVIDMVFSIDSIITAVGMADHVEVMIAAVIVAVGLMFVASGPIAGFVSTHPTTKMLALAFLLLIGVSLVADGLGLHIPKGYIYSAMAFAVMVEAINIFASKRRAANGHPVAVPAGEIAAEAAREANAATANRRPKSTPQSRATARPKSAPRKKR